MQAEPREEEMASGEQLSHTPSYDEERRKKISLDGQLREDRMNERHSLLVRLAGLEKLLGIKRRCKSCGSDIRVAVILIKTLAISGLTF